MTAGDGIQRFIVAYNKTFHGEEAVGFNIIYYLAFDGSHIRLLPVVEQFRREIIILDLFCLMFSFLTSIPSAIPCSCLFFRGFVFYIPGNPLTPSGASRMSSDQIRIFIRVRGFTSARGKVYFTGLILFLAGLQFSYSMLSELSVFFYRLKC